VTTDATPQGAGADVAAPVNSGGDPGGGRQFVDGVEVVTPVTAPTDADADEDAAAEGADADADDADGEEGAELAEDGEAAEGEDDGAEGLDADVDGEASDAEDFSFPEVEGHDWNDGEKAAARPFLEDLLADDLSPEERAEKVLARYAEARAALVARDGSSAQTAREELVNTWGDEETYRSNIAALNAFLDDAKKVPPELAQQIVTARAGDGTRIINNPAFASLLLQLAKGQAVTERQPTQTRTPPNKRDAVSEELAEIDALMHRDLHAYTNQLWKTTGKNASDRALELRREIAASEKPQDAEAPPSAREREIDRIMHTGIDRYQRENLGDELLNLMRARTGGKR
jgi:hypothetical protein